MFVALASYGQPAAALQPTAAGEPSPGVRDYSTAFGGSLSSHALQTLLAHQPDQDLVKGKARVTCLTQARASNSHRPHCRAHRTRTLLLIAPRTPPHRRRALSVGGPA